MNLRVPRGHNDFKILNGLVPNTDVLRDTVLKQDNILIHYGKRSGEYHTWNFAPQLSVVADFSSPRLV